MAWEMTPRQGQYLSFIHRYITRRGVAPSFEEIGAHFGTSAPSVNSMIKTLERRGLLSRVPGAARTLRVEAPAHLLPDGEFGNQAARRSSGFPLASTPVVVDVAVAVAVTVLDALAPLAFHGDRQGQAAIDVIAEIAQAARIVAMRMGLEDESSASIARRLGAEAAR